MLNQIDLSRLDLNLLVLFEVVLAERHVARAATRLHLSPSAVSHGLSRLRRLFNDPLFLRTPKGVVPSARALELSEPIADVLARVRRVVASSEPFEARTSTRRFIIGAPDGISAAILPDLLARLRDAAPGIDIGIREVLPVSGSRSRASFWAPALAELEVRAMDLAVLPIDRAPTRFAARVLYEDDFVIAMRSGHPFASKPTLDRFCQMQHLIVSLTADAYSFVDEALADLGLSRRIALTVPNFMIALATLAQSDLVAAVPRRLGLSHAQRFGLLTTEPPMPLPRFAIRAVAPNVALMDAGVAWLLDTLTSVTAPGNATRRSRSRKQR
jgi:DNA-binding transcriptional LysR family regulator